MDNPQSFSFEMEPHVLVQYVVTPQRHVHHVHLWIIASPQGSRLDYVRTGEVDRIMRMPLVGFHGNPPWLDVAVLPGEDLALLFSSPTGGRLTGRIELDEGQGKECPPHLMRNGRCVRCTRYQPPIAGDDRDKLAKELEATWPLIEEPAYWIIRRPGIKGEHRTDVPPGRAVIATRSGPPWRARNIASHNSRVEWMMAGADDVGAADDRVTVLCRVAEPHPTCISDGCMFGGAPRCSRCGNLNHTGDW